MRGEGVVRLRWDPIVVIVLHWKVWTSGNAILEQLGAESTTVRHVLQHDATGTCALARDGHAGGVAVEEVDVLLDPLQSEMLVEDACVDCAFAVDLIGGDETESSKLDTISQCILRCFK